MTTGRINQVARPPRRRARRARPTPRGEGGDDGATVVSSRAAKWSRPIVAPGRKDPRAKRVCRIRERSRYTEGRSRRGAEAVPSFEGARGPLTLPLLARARRGERMSAWDEVVFPTTG